MQNTTCIPYTQIVHTHNSIQHTYAHLRRGGIWPSANSNSKGDLFPLPFVVIWPSERGNSSCAQPKGVGRKCFRKHKERGCAVLLKLWSLLRPYFQSWLRGISNDIPGLFTQDRAPFGTHLQDEFWPYSRPLCMQSRAMEQLPLPTSATTSVLLTIYREQLCFKLPPTRHRRTKSSRVYLAVLY